MNAVIRSADTSELVNSEIVEEINIDELNENILAKLHPKLADVIKTIQAEKLGDEAIAWSDFSQHNKS